MSTTQLERQAERVAVEAGDRGGPSGSNQRVGASQPVPELLRAPVEDALGVDLSGVRIHTNVTTPTRGAGQTPSMAGALTCGEDIYFGLGAYLPSRPEGRQLLRHELTHVAQQRAGAGIEEPWMTKAEDYFATRDLLDGPLRAEPGLTQRGDCIGPAKEAKEPAIDKLLRGEKISEADAREIMDAYDSLGDAERRTAVGKLYSYGAATSQVRVLLESLSEKDRFDTYREPIKDLLYKVQHTATLAAAGGVTWTELAKKQGAFMQTEAEAEALKKKQAAAKAKGLPIPKAVSSGEVKKAHEDAVEASSIAKAPPKTEWDKVADKAAWMKNAEAVRARVVKECAKVAPHLAIEEKDITIDPDKIAKRGKNIFSLAGRPMTVGMTFIEAADANPAYVIGAVLHEIHGHPLHGKLSEGLEWKLYDESTKHFKDYTKPADRSSEHDLYGYLGTEIFAEMIEADYEVPISAADRAKGIRGSDVPAQSIDERVRTLIKHYEPTVAKALLLGLWERFRVDPRISSKSLKLYKDAVNGRLPGTIP